MVRLVVLVAVDRPQVVELERDLVVVLEAEREVHAAAVEHRTALGRLIGLEDPASML